MSRRTKKTFADLTWADLEAWAGAKIVSRGKDYQKHGYVKDLVLTPDGGLLAWVRGSDDYATTVTFDKGRLSSVCTCPFDGNCKHAVAVVLDCLDRLKKKIKISLADEDDERFLLLEDESLALDGDEDDIEGDEYDEFSADDERQSVRPNVLSALKKKSKRELEAMLSGILKDHPELMKELGFTTSRAAGNKGCDALVKAVTKAIVVTSREQGWRNYWKHTGHTPDYSSVRKGLRQLLDAGCEDDVVKLGEKLFTRGTEQVEQSHDEGETADELAQTMPIVFKALAGCSLSDLDKLERAVDFGLRDEYDLCRGLDEFLQHRFGKKVWSDLADRLFARLKEMKPETQGDSFFRHYERDRLSDEVMRALEKAGRTEESIALCFHEAEATGSYERLVRKLRSAGRTIEAEEWIRKGVSALRDKLPGIASSLKKELLDIRQLKKDWLFVAALRSDDFFTNPSLNVFKDLERACEKGRVWPEIRDACLKFLETGTYPGGKAGWPLPDTGFWKPELFRRDKPPLADILIDIAVEEKRVDDVVRWYEARKRRTKAWPEAHRDDMVATAIAQAYPERAVAIWKRLAEGFIAQTKAGAYGEAVTYLKKVKKALTGLGKEAEWTAYLTQLTEAHKRKSRLIQMLNVLSGKTIRTK